MPDLAETWPNVNQEITICQNASFTSIENQPSDPRLHNQEIRRYNELPESNLASIVNEEVVLYHPAAHIIPHHQ
jgi:hypothetical protein